MSEDHAYMNIIYDLKYRGIRGIGRHFGQMLGERIQKTGIPVYDAIVPVPIHHARKRERGYNQSDMIAEGLAAVMDIPVDGKLIFRTSNTTSQTTLSKAERLDNIKGKIAVNPRKNVAGKCFLICDDVMTTGSTLNNCAHALIAAGAANVDAAVLAMA